VNNITTNNATRASQILRGSNELLRSKSGQLRNDIATQLVHRLDQNGSLDDKCDSRVLESVLVALLLRRSRDQRYAPARDEIVRFLFARRPHVDRFHQILIDTLLTPCHARSDGAFELVKDALRFTQSRKELTFRVLLAELGNKELNISATEAHAIQYGDEATWGNVLSCALRILACLQAGAEVRDGDCRYLGNALAAPGPTGVYEGHVLAHVMALLALQRMGRGQRLTDEGISNLLRHQRDDGGLPFITTIRTFCTATAALGLLHCPGKEGEALRMASYLASIQWPNGGWSYGLDVLQTDADDTAYCLELIRACDKGQFHDSVKRAEAYLTSLSSAGMGVPTFKAHHAPEVAMTAGAINAFNLRQSQYSHQISSWLQSILDRQQDDGRFERSWSLSEANAIFRSLKAFRRALDCDFFQPMHARLRMAQSKAVTYLLSTQNPDGGWGQQAGMESDAISTAYSVLALPSQNSKPIWRGVSFMIDNSGNGIVHSIPDQAGPRPIPWNVPVLADITVLWALNQVLNA
jgi:prenyltransferase beta subunit